MIKVRDGYGKLIGSDYNGNIAHVLLSNGGNLQYAVGSTASTLVLRNASGQIESSVASTVAPFVISSTKVNANLNADLLDGFLATSLFQSLTSAADKNLYIKIGDTEKEVSLLYASYLGGVTKEGLFTELINVNDSTNPNSIKVTIGDTTKYLKVAYSDLAGKVVCSSSTNNVDRPIVVTNTSNGVYYSTKVTLNYSTGNVTAPTFTGNLIGNADTATTASKLSTVSKTAWGLTYWTSGGVPTDISGDMTGVGNITIASNGNVDRFITFDTTSTRNWRIGYLGTGSGDANYLIFQSTKTLTIADGWHDMLKIGCETGNATFTGQLTAAKFVGPLNSTLTFSAGAFSAKTYNNSAAVTVNIPTHTSHLTNNSGFLTKHQSLDNYVTLNTNQTITGLKTFQSNSSTTGVSLILKNNGWTGNMSTAMDFYNGRSYTVPNARIETKMAGDGKAGGTLIFYTLTKHGSTNPNPNGLTERLRIDDNGTTKVLGTLLVSGTSVYPLSIDTSGSENGLLVKMEGSAKTWIGYTPGTGAYLYTYAGPHKLGISDSGVGFIDSNTILHSGNSSVADGGSTWGSKLTVKINGTAKTLTIPANPNTDSKVSLSETTTSSYRPVILGYTSSSTAGSGMTTSTTNVVYASNKFYAQPSTGNLYATLFNGVLNTTSNLYYADSKYGILMNNSDIIGTNAIYFGDAADSAGEGINFYRSSTTWDTLTAAGGILYFSANRATATHTLTPVFSALSNSGNNISITIGGLNRTLTPAYASSAGSAAYSNYIYSHDTRNDTIKPNTYGNGFRCHFLANGTNGVNDGGNYYGLLHIKHYGSKDDHSGGYPHQIAFTPNNNLWHRIGTSGTAWGSWIKILDSNNYTTVLDSRYVNASGDTMTGALHLAYATSATMTTGSANPQIIFSENGGLKVLLMYTDYDSYRSPAGLKVLGEQGGEWFEVAGSCYAAHFYEHSDINLKTNIEIINTSDNIPRLKSFDWKSDGSRSYGLIAQELEEMGYSELVDSSGDHKTVKYSAALSLIVGKLQVKIKELEKEIEILKNKN